VIRNLFVNIHEVGLFAEGKLLFRQRANCCARWPGPSPGVLGKSIPHPAHARVVIRPRSCKHARRLGRRNRIGARVHPCDLNVFAAVCH
jgi:hypothetical protein